MDSKTVLTAAHCTSSANTDYTKHYVMVGATNKAQGQKIKIAKVINHPNWDSANINNDISILKLAEPITFGNNVQAMCLPSSTFAPVAGVDCYTSGWGLTNYRK